MCVGCCLRAARAAANSRHTPVLYYGGKLNHFLGVLLIACYIVLQCNFLFFGVYMQISLRLNDRLAARAQPYLDRGLTKTVLLTSALDFYLSALESSGGRLGASLDVLPDNSNSAALGKAEEQIEMDIQPMSRAEKRRLKREKSKKR